MKESKIQGPWEGKRYDYQDNHEQTMKTLIDTLRNIKSQYNIVGIKQSFEDEGVILNDVMTMRRITEMCDLKMYVKIGGCEAITDINNCVNMGINTLIAPMVETTFSLKKYIDAVKNINSTDFYFVCETKTAADNLKDMLDSDVDNSISGVVVGRSDFTKSFGLSKSKVDSGFMNQQVESALETIKNKNLKTTMGGNISVQSSDFIKRMYTQGLLDNIETRNVVIGLNDKNINRLDQCITNALKFEIDWMCYKSSNYTSIGNSYHERVQVLKRRI